MSPKRMASKGTKPVAIVTGASSGIGRSIALRLLDLNYKVVGISRKIRDEPIDHPDFQPLECDLSEISQIELCIKTLLSETAIYILVNAAGFGRFRPHEEYGSMAISKMTNVNLAAPMILCSLFLRTLKKNRGTIINITSIEAVRSSKFSALYSATKSGLRAFGQSLFEEVRKSGVNVVTINPDMTDTNFFEPLNFGISKDTDAHLLSEDIADTVEQILTMREGACITEITIRPQRFGISKKKFEV